MHLKLTVLHFSNYLEASLTWIAGTKASVYLIYHLY